MTTVIDAELIRAWVAADFALELASFAEVNAGADENARLWRASGPGGDFAVKLSGGGSAAGLQVAARLAASGVPGIPAPIATRDGRLFSDYDGHRLSVVPWIAGVSALGADMTTEHWRAYGALLAGVHRLAVTDDLAQLLPAESLTHERFSAYAKVVDARVQAAAQTADPLARQLAQLWPQAAAEMWKLVSRADELAFGLKQPVSNVVCHGDPHLGNLLLAPDGQVWLIDWDDALLAPIEKDLMFVTTGVLAFAPVTPAQRFSFFSGYGQKPTDPDLLAYFLAVRALGDLTSWANQVIDAQRFDEADREFAWKIVQGLLSPNGLVTLALAA